MCWHDWRGLQNSVEVVRLCHHISGTMECVCVSVSVCLFVCASPLLWWICLCLLVLAIGRSQSAACSGGEGAVSDNSAWLSQWLSVRLSAGGPGGFFTSLGQKRHLALQSSGAIVCCGDSLRFPLPNTTRTDIHAPAELLGVARVASHRHVVCIYGLVRTCE